MAIKLDHIIILSQRLLAELTQLRSQEPDTSLGEPDRWALFVTPKELNALMDEAAVRNVFADMTPQEAQGIREGRGLLRLNGVAVFPELQDKNEALNG